MDIKTFLITLIVFLFIFANTDGRKSGGGGGGRRSSGGSWSSRRGGGRTTQRPRTQSGSTPDKIGWNVPPSNNKPTSTNVKASAPVSEHAGKTSATNVQSGYNPSGGYPRQPASNPYGGTGYNSNQGYPGSNHPPPYPGYGGQSSYGQSYPGGMHHAPPAYSPSYNPGGMNHAPPAYSPSYNPGGMHHAPPAYSPSYGQQVNPSYVQPSLAQAPALTVLQPSRPGIGQLAKEALVYSSVSAGVSAAVNRLLPGGIYGHSPGYGSGAAGGGGSHTEVTYNNYYYNQSDPTNPQTRAVPADGASNPVAPAQPSLGVESDKKAETSASNNAAPTNNGPPNPPPTQQNNNPSTPNYPISNDEVKKLTESLFEADKNNAYKYITVNLQSETKEDSTTDDAPLPLLDVKAEAYDIPTIKDLLALSDNDYELDVKTKETITPEQRKEISDLLDKFLETDVFKMAMKFLVDKGLIPNDEYEFKDTLKRIWFSQFQRVEGEPTSSGFEAVFLAEKIDSYMVGPQNWIYYAKQEAQKNLDYRGYIKDVKLGDKARAIKLRTAFTIPDTKHSVTTILVGLSPELEMALYTLCFYVRPNDVCPASLGGKDVMLVSSRVNIFGKDVLIAGFVAG